MKWGKMLRVTLYGYGYLIMMMTMIDGDDGDNDDEDYGGLLIDDC